MKQKWYFLVFLGVSIALTSFAYFLDRNDNHYPNIWHTILEFVLWTGVLFTIMVSIYFIRLFIKRLITKKT